MERVSIRALYANAGSKTNQPPSVNGDDSFLKDPDVPINQSFSHLRAAGKKS